ncbi:protein NUCLEAR FUSION DEFECTIVE 4-like [Cucurbita pepo subsp. pepo]|uniref:protein NUCLEAR FUSION DEFECTIVE 4-like n=1 Tax=Cucurbita pepo subsp. pepo TaxID=3664 RepID=UPI000C9D43DB|nr:protein NUCLEAR FUSION DEFECTIVE 4-like [Cucurbita pepo subsp. pepo]
MPSSVFQWLSLLGIIWLQSINGTNFNFPSYSSQLKHHLSISQFQLNNLAFASDAGKLFACVSGLAANYLPLWSLLIIGSCLGLVGYGVQYLFITNQFHSPSYCLIFFLTVLAGNSICWINTVCYIVAIRNFPSNRQVAVGISTSYQGLSAKIYTDIVGLIFTKRSDKTAETFLLSNSVFPLGVCVLVCPMARIVELVEEKGNLGVGFFVIFVITIATGVFAVVTSVGSISRMLSPLSGLVGILVFLLLPVVVPVVESVKKSVREGKERRVYHSTMEEDTRIRPENEAKLNRDGGDDAMEEIGAREMVTRVNFWLYVGVYFFGATLGLAFLNNLGQIAESRGSESVSSLVSLSSSFGFFGRLMPSLLDHFLSRRKMMKSKPGWMVGLMGAMCGGFFFLLSGPTDLILCVSTAVIAVCTGAITSISVSTTSELFGANNFSINHNVVVANIPFGSFLFGYMAAYLYRKQATGGAGKCIGVECYRTTFMIWGCLCSFGTLLALLLFARTRSFYSTTKSQMAHGST